MEVQRAGVVAPVLTEQLDMGLRKYNYRWRPRLTIRHEDHNQSIAGKWDKGPLPLMQVWTMYLP